MLVREPNSKDQHCGKQQSCKTLKSMIDWTNKHQFHSKSPVWNIGLIHRPGFLKLEQRNVSKNQQKDRQVVSLTVRQANIPTSKVLGPELILKDSSQAIPPSFSEWHSERTILLNCASKHFVKLYLTSPSDSLDRNEDALQWCEIWWIWQKYSSAKWWISIWNRPNVKPNFSSSVCLLQGTLISLRTSTVCYIQWGSVEIVLWLVTFYGWKNCLICLKRI